MHTYTHAHTHTHAQTHTRTHTHKRTRTHTHTGISTLAPFTPDPFFAMEITEIQPLDLGDFHLDPREFDQLIENAFGGYCVRVGLVTGLA